MPWPTKPAYISARPIYNGEKLRLQVITRQMAGYITHDEPYVVISVTGPWHMEHEGPTPLAESPNRLDTLRLSFHDIDVPEEGKHHFNEDDAKLVLDFAMKHLDSSPLFVIHCELGRSRSAAIAAAISKWINGDDFFFYKNFTPNSLVFRTLLNMIHDPELPYCEKIYADV